ncbi:hypothetical protein ACFY9R_29845 [Streptomyces albidoflavus]|uniref:hypothetical protein n=1 Tax=Streptomyces albidoflavus TaxID=1886 RepID=UPI0033C4C4AC
MSEDTSTSLGLPHDLTAEQILLGAMLRTPNAVTEVVEGPYDLCVEFAAREGEHLPLAELARKCGVNTWQHLEETLSPG